MSDQPPEPPDWRPPTADSPPAPDPASRWTPPTGPGQAWAPPVGVDQPGRGYPPGPGYPGHPDQGYRGPYPPPVSKSNRTAIAIVLIVSVVLVGLIVVGGMLLGNSLSGLGGLGERTPLADVEVGQCFDGIKASDFDSDAPQVNVGLLFGVQVLDCAEPHEGELLGRVRWPAERGDEYPGEEEVVIFAEGACAQAFGDYVGVSYHASELSMTYVYPQLRSWREGVRTVECVANPPSGVDRESGSVRDSNR